MSLIDTLQKDAETLADTLGVQNFPSELSGLFLALVKRLEVKVPELLADELAPAPAAEPEPEPAPALPEPEPEPEPEPPAVDPAAVQAEAETATAEGSTAPTVAPATPDELLAENVELKASIAELEARAGIKAAPSA